ncbi:MAG TPA: NifB/NifX family molybdenum-iron cluster-binding protein [Methanocella sp.]
MSEKGLESDVCAHFGSCEYFTIIDVDGAAIKSIDAISNGTPGAEHNCAAPAVLLKSHDVNIVLVSGIGGRPLMSLNEKMIKVFAGAVGQVSDAVEDYNAGLLQELATQGTCNCSHH